MTRQRRRKQPSEPFDAGPFLRHAGDMIHRAREAQEVSVDALGERIGTVRSHLYKFEHGDVWLHPAKLLHTAIALQVPPPVLLQVPHAPPTTMDQILALLVDAPPDMQMIVLGWLRGLHEVLEVRQPRIVP